MQTLAFIEMPKILKASEIKKYSVYQDELIKTVDRILMAKLGEKKVYLHAYYVQVLPRPNELAGELVI